MDDHVRNHLPIFFPARPDVESSGGVRAPPGGEPLRSQNMDGGYVQTFTVTVVKELSDSPFALCWHDSTLCNY